MKLHRLRGWVSARFRCGLLASGEQRAHASGALSTPGLQGELRDRRLIDATASETLEVGRSGFPSIDDILAHPDGFDEMFVLSCVRLRRVQ